MPRLAHIGRKGLRFAYLRLLPLFVALVCPHSLAEAPVLPPSEVVFEWDAIEGAEGYRLEISESKEFSKVVQAHDVDGLEKVVKLAPNRKFYWRVAGKNFLGDLGEWSDTGFVLVKVAPPPPPPKIVEAPPPPPPQKVEKVAAEKKIFPKYPNWIRFGLASGFRSEGISGDDYHVGLKGFWMGRVNLAGAFRVKRHEIELRGSYQRQGFEILDSALPALQPTLGFDWIRVSALWRGSFKVAGYPVTLGTSLFQRPNVKRQLGETLTIDTIRGASLLAGISQFSSIDAPWYQKWEILADIAPVGQWRHIGASFEITTGYAFGKGELSAELVVGFHPLLYVVTPNINTGLACDLSGALVLKWSFGSNVKPVARKKDKEVIPASR